MSEPYVGEIRMFGGNFAPLGWAFCDGQLLAIAENETLFQLIGTTYGGDGQTTFAVPDLRGRLPLHMGQGPGLSARTIGEKAGVEQVSLTVNQIPAHTHPLAATTDLAGSADPQDAVPARTNPAVIDTYTELGPLVALSPQAMTSSGGGQPHDNLMPYQCVSFIISLFGIFPSPT